MSLGPSLTPATRAELELGMPHLGPSALDEAAMLKHLGHLRWSAFETLTGLPMRKVRDADGRRLYATFYHVDMEFPLSTLPHTFREGDRIVWVGALGAFGRNVLDGHFALYRGSDPRNREWGAPDRSRAASFLNAGIPVVRLSNIFIAQQQGPEILRVSQPANADLSVLPALAEPPDGHRANREAEAAGRFFSPREGSAPTTSTEIAYDIDPDRDVNGVGLVYFANFTSFFERGERAALARVPHGGLPRDIVDRRETRRRVTGFFANAAGDDALRLRVEIALHPEPIRTSEGALGCFWSTIVAHRNSDARIVAVTTAERVARLESPREEDSWRRHAGHLA